MADSAQRYKILVHMQDGKDITPVEALQNFGCFRLAARIKEIRDQGYKVQTIRDPRGFAIYRMGAARGLTSNGK